MTLCLRDGQLLDKAGVSVRGLLLWSGFSLKRFSWLNSLSITRAGWGHCFVPGLKAKPGTLCPDGSSACTDAQTSPPGQVGATALDVAGKGHTGCTGLVLECGVVL